MNVTTRNLLRNAVGLVLTALFFVYLWSIRRDFLAAFRSVHGLQWANLGGVLLLHWGIRAWRDRWLYAAAGHSLKAVPVFWSNNVQLALNYLPLKAGTVSSAGVLYSGFGVRPQAFMVVMVQQYLLNALVASVLGAVALWFSPGIATPAAGIATVVFMGLTTVSFGLLAWNGLTRFLPGGLARRFEQAGSQQIALFKGSRPAAAAIVALTIGMCLASAFRMTIVFGIVSISIGFADALVISAALMLSPLIAVTPAGLGISESLVALTAVLLSHPGPQGVMAATIDRTATLGFAVLLGVLLAPLAWPTDSHLSQGPNR
jgi:uncharacterized membrane protein YbhN (UPF0104 family)